MRRLLAAAVALAPLCLVSAAHADDTISGGQKGPVVTATSGSVTINSGGSVNPGTLAPQPGCAANQSANSPTGAKGCPLVGVFLNGTGTNVTNSGSIGSSSLTKAGGATGILIQGGASGQVLNNSTITLTDGYAPPTDQNTGYIYGVWSNSTSPQNNYGIRLIAGSGAYTGYLNSALNSSISVYGNNSYGLSIEAPLVADGALTEPTIVGSGAGPARTIAIETNSVITVSGDNSVGVNLAGPVTGDVWIKSAVTVTGHNAVGLQTSQDINGRLTLGGAISATGYHYTTRPIDSTMNGFAAGPFTAGTGPNKGINTETIQGGSAVVVGANVTGGVLLDSTPLISTSTTTTTNGSTVTITTGNPNAPANDQDLNGITDANQTTGSISSFGSAPALVVAGANPITLGVVGTTELGGSGSTSSNQINAPTATQLYDYGLILKGAVNADGVFDTFNATAIQLGGTPGTASAGQAVNIAGGGLFTSGGVSANAYQATATAILVNPGVSMAGDSINPYGGITNFGGTISATSNGSGVRATSGWQSEANQRAVAIDIEDGASVPYINNVASPYSSTGGVISASTAGAYGSAIAIVDKSTTNTLTVNNQGAIVAQVDVTPGITPQDESPVADYTPAGYCAYNTPAANQKSGQACAIAIDARNTTGLKIIQTQASVGNLASPILEGDIYLPQSTTGLSTAKSQLQIQSGLVAGTINLGNGAVDLQVGSPSGCASTTSCATVAGPLFYAGDKLSIEVYQGGVLANGLGKASLSGKVTTALNVQSLFVATGGTLYAAINPNSPNNDTGYVAQTADLQAGAKLAVSYVTLPTLGQTTVSNFLTAQNLTVENGLDTSSLVHPYMLQVSLASGASTATTPGAKTGAGDLPIVNSPNCSGICVVTTAATPAAMNKAEGQFYTAAYNSLASGNDSDLTDLFLGKTTAANFFRDYTQLMPVPAGATLLSLASGERAINRALGDNRPLAEPGETTGWTQEINFYADHNSNDGLGFRTHGIGVASGLERGLPYLGAVGVSMAFTSGDMSTPGQMGSSDLGATNYEAGLYWRFEHGGWRAWARGAAGFATFNSTRDFIDNPTQSLTQVTTTTTTATNPVTNQKTTATTYDYNSTAPLERIATATWNGYTLSSAAGLSWEKHFLRRFYARPEASIEYYYLSENGYTEEDASGGINGIPLIVGARAGHMLTTSAMMNLGARFGDVAGQGGFTAELQFGYRDNVATDPGLTSIAFVDNPTVKSLLAADSLTGGGPVAGFRLMAGGAMGYISLEGDVDDLQAYTEYVLMLRAAYRF